MRQYASFGLTIDLMEAVNESRHDKPSYPIASILSISETRQSTFHDLYNVSLALILFLCGNVLPHSHPLRPEAHFLTLSVKTSDIPQTQH